MRATLVVVVLALVSCGRFGFGQRDGGPADAAVDAVPDDTLTSGPIAGDPNGSWTFVEARVVGEGSVRRSADLQNGIRGNGAIAPGALDLGFVLLANGVSGTIASGASELTIEGDRWVSTDGTIVTAATAHWNSPDDLTLTWNPDDPATMGTPALEMIRIVRAVPPPASLVGTKKLKLVTYQGLPEFKVNLCAPNVENTTQIVNGDIIISDRFLVDVAFEFQFFASTDCSGDPDVVTNTGPGYLEVEGTRYRLWLSLDTYEPVAMTGDITITADAIRLVRDSCEPAASTACADLPIAAQTSP